MIDWNKVIQFIYSKYKNNKSKLTTPISNWISFLFRRELNKTKLLMTKKDLFLLLNLSKLLSWSKINLRKNKFIKRCLENFIRHNKILKLILNKITSLPFLSRNLFHYLLQINKMDLKVNFKIYQRIVIQLLIIRINLDNSQIDKWII